MVSADLVEFNPLLDVEDKTLSVIKTIIAGAYSVAKSILQ